MQHTQPPQREPQHYRRPQTDRRIPDYFPQLVGQDQCSCGGRIMEITEVWGMLCAACRFDHALKVYRPSA